MNVWLPKKIIGVVGDPRRELKPLLDAVEELHPVEFLQTGADTPATSRLDALLVVEHGPEFPPAVVPPSGSVPVLRVLLPPRSFTAAAPREVRFGASLLLDACLRQQRATEWSGTPAFPLHVEAGDDVLATAEGAPIWLARRQPAQSIQIVGVPVAALQPKEFLFQHFNGGRFMSLLPLLHFVRLLVSETDWSARTLPACFIIDDPNLHRPSYGFLDFQRLADEAVSHDFFVSLAMIPLDAWGVNPRVAEIFRRVHPRLSLLIHGNNHARGEMLARGEAKVLSLAAEACRRMERLERHGLASQRLMVAPHGAIAEDVFPSLSRLGFEGVFCTPELFVRHNPDAALPASFGLARSFVVDGLPLIPRIKPSPRCDTEVLLAALLRQPIVVAAHHWNLADGYDDLARLARRINQFPGVQWSTPCAIARVDYEQLVWGEVLNVKAFARRIVVPVCDHSHWLVVHRPWLDPVADDEPLVVLESGREIFRSARSGIAGPISLAGSGDIAISSPRLDAVDCHTVAPPPLRCWPVLRRLLAETRDRTAPWTRRAIGHARPAMPSASE